MHEDNKDIESLFKNYTKKADLSVCQSTNIIIKSSKIIIAFLQNTLRLYTIHYQQIHILHLIQIQAFLNPN